MRIILILSVVAYASTAKLDGFLKKDGSHFQSSRNFGKQLDQRQFQSELNSGRQLDTEQQEQFNGGPVPEEPAQPPTENVQVDEELSSAGGLAEGVITDEREAPVGAVFRYLLEKEDGTRIEQSGRAGVNGTVVITGSYTYTSPEGETIEVTYTADETGFHPESNSIPVGPEIPEYVRQQVADSGQTAGQTVASQPAVEVAQADVRLSVDGEPQFIQPEDQSVSDLEFSRR